MAITINGTGSITGLTAGGLPDGSITTDDIAANAVTAAKLAAGAGGKILQVVTTDYTGQFSTSTANTWTQITGLNTSITLSSSSSRVLILVSLGQHSSNNGVGVAFGATRGGSLILTGVQESQRIPVGWFQYHVHLSHSQSSQFIAVDTPGASGSHTYGVQARAQGSCTVYVNRAQNNDDTNDTYAGRAGSHLTLMEIAS